MGDQAPIPSAATVAWLLEGDDPSVRYCALIDLLAAAPGDPEVVVARREIMTGGTVPSILCAQGDDGHWGERDRYYVAKYRGTAWQLIILAELGADGADERVRRACEAILRDAQDAESGGFSVNCAKAVGGRHGSVIPCLTGNLIFSLIKLGYLDDPRVRRAIDWITTSASTTPTATRPLAGPTTRGRCAGAATPATWGRSRLSRRSRRNRPSAVRRRSGGPWPTASSSGSGTMSTDAATTSRTTPNPAGGGSAFRS